MKLNPLDDTLYSIVDKPSAAGWAQVPLSAVWCGADGVPVAEDRWAAGLMVTWCVPSFPDGSAETPQRAVIRELGGVLVALFDNKVNVEVESGDLLEQCSTFLATMPVTAPKETCFQRAVTFQ